MATLTADQWLSGYANAVQSVREAVLEYARTAWVAQGTNLRSTDVDRLVSLLVPRVQAGQIQIANLTSSYIAAAHSVKTGKAAKPTPVARDEILNARGVPDSAVFRRPANTVYTELSAGASFDDAKEAGLGRLVSIVSTGMQMAKVRQARVSFQGSGIRFYKRVPTGRENCALCLIASTQRYFAKDLLPIHPGCDCDVEELGVGEDPDQVIDRELLEATHDRVQAFAGISDRGGRAPDYRELLISHEHGEIGPVLGWRGQKFTGPADLM